MDTHNVDPTSLDPTLPKAVTGDLSGITAVPDEFDYRSPPPHRVGTISVKYVFGGRGKPLPYPIDDEE